MSRGPRKNRGVYEGGQFKRCTPLNPQCGKARLLGPSFCECKSYSPLEVVKALGTTEMQRERDRVESERSRYDD